MFKYLKRADLKKYDALGFDLDHAFAQYKNDKLFSFVYDLFAKRLTSKLPEITADARAYLDGEIAVGSREFELANTKGWVYDNQNECYIWLEVRDDSTAYVRKLMRGFRRVTTDKGEIESIYTGQKFAMIRRLLMPQQLENSWHPTSNPSHHVIENNFEYAYFAAHLKLMDLYHDKQLDNSIKFTELRDYCNESINHMFSEPSPYFQNFELSPTEYLQKATSYAEYLKSLGKPLFLLTNSGPNYSNVIGNEILGPEWQQTFDCLIFKGKKPSFFTGSKDFQSMNRQSLMPVSNTKHVARRGSRVNDGFYLMGNPKPVNTLLQGLTCQSEPKVLFFGDSVVSDIAFNCWDRCFIETDVHYPSWVDEVTPEKNTRLIEYTSSKYETFRINTLSDLVEKTQNGDHMEE